MFIVVTNAVNGRRVTISPNLIGMMEGRQDDRHPNTNSVIILNDQRGTFIPCRETEDELFTMLSRAQAAPTRRQVTDVRQPDPEGAPEER